MKKALTLFIFIAALMVASCAFAQDFAVSSLPLDSLVAPVDGVYVLDEPGLYVAYGSTMENSIIVGADVELILSDARMDLSGVAGASPVSVRSGAHLTLVLDDGTTNLLWGGAGAAGLEAETGSRLTIRCESGAGHACTDACGTLHAYGGAASGGEAEEVSAMTWAGFSTPQMGEPVAGNIQAAGAGIGGSAGKSSGSITIESGRINARGGESSSISGGAAGVGGGGNTEKAKGKAHGENITISGGLVQATGAVGAAGIGGGDWKGEGRNILISGGAVVANGGDGAAAIGGGFLGAGKNIRISGGAVAAYGGEEASGIGGGYYGQGTDLVISGGRVQATAGSQYDYPRPDYPIDMRRKNYKVSPVNDAIGSGAEAVDASVRVEPGMTAVAARCGKTQQDAPALKGSPFAARTTITSLTDDAGYAEFWEEPMPAGTANVPRTGDDTPVLAYICLALLSSTAWMTLRRRLRKA